jgi:hypothetical protein
MSRRWKKVKKININYFNSIIKLFLRDFACPPESSRTRRKSIYNFFLGRQDAVDDHMTSPSVHKKVIRPNINEAPLPNTSNTSETLTSPPSKHKRASSFIKKKPRLERGLSDHSVLRLNKSANLGEN